MTLKRALSIRYKSRAGESLLDYHFSPRNIKQELSELTVRWLGQEDLGHTSIQRIGLQPSILRRRLLGRSRVRGQETRNEGVLCAK